MIYISIPLTSMILDKFEMADCVLYFGLGLSVLIGCLYFVVPYLFKIKIQIGKEDVEFETAEQVFVEHVATPQNPEKDFSLKDQTPTDPIQF